MAAKKGSFTELLYKKIMPKIYGIGAAVVILGALFKIQHYPGSSVMLIVGLGTEALIFFLSAFEPPHAEPDWSRVYPELAEDFSGPDSAPRRSLKSGSSSEDSTVRKLDQALEKKLTPDLIESLGKGMNNLAASAKNMSNLSDAAVATNEYATNVKKASTSLTEMNKSYASTAEAMKGMSEASNTTREYHKIVQSVTKNLGALNAVYEMELQDANSHLKAMNKFYSNVTSAMENVGEASKEAENFRVQMAGLSKNLTSLNSVYGKMLAAMRGGGDAAPASAPKQG